MDISLKSPKLSIKNKYKLELYDTEGNLLQEVTCHNQASARKYTMNAIHGTIPGIADSQCGYQRPYYDLTKGMTGVHLGVGTGEIAIDSRNYLFKRVFGSSISWTRMSDFTFNNMHYRASATFPATTSYVGELTEIGLGPASCCIIFSHALLADAEGNPIVVSKTDTNILVVTIDIFITASMPTQPFNFKYYPAWASTMGGAGQKPSSRAPQNLPGTGGKWFYYSQNYCPESDAGNILKNCIGDYFNETYWTTGGLDQSTAAYFPYPYKALNMRLNAGDSNFGFAHSVVFPGFGIIPLPNEAICPAYEYKGISIGTGDGSTQVFLPAVNEVVSAKVYIDGVLSDATFQNFDPKKSPLWNKCIRVDYMQSTSNIYCSHPVPSYGFDNNGTACMSIPMSSGCATRYTAWGTSPEFTPSSFTGKADYSSLSIGSMPIYYDEAGITLDHFRVGKACLYASSSPYYTYTGYEYSLQYSDDGNTWTTACVSDVWYTCKYFTAITAKYWRIVGGPSCGRDTFKGAATTPTEEAYIRAGFNPNYIVAGNSAEFDFGKCGINFTTAPADGAVITMDATLNLPYKDNNTVFICSYEAEVPDPGEAT